MNAGESTTEQNERRKGVPFFADQSERDRPATDQTRPQQQRAPRPLGIDISANRHAGEAGAYVK